MAQSIWTYLLIEWPLRDAPTSHHHHHHPSAAEQATTRFLHARRSSANAATLCSCIICLFIIPKQSLYIIKVWSTWSTRSPFANGWNVQSISSSRLFLWHSEDVTKKFQLAVPNQMNQRHSVSHGIDGGVQNMVNALYIQHDSVAWGSKGVDFVFHILGDHPRFTAIE